MNKSTQYIGLSILFGAIAIGGIVMWKNKKNSKELEPETTHLIQETNTAVSVPITPQKQTPPNQVQAINHGSPNQEEIDMMNEANYSLKTKTPPNQVQAITHGSPNQEAIDKMNEANYALKTSQIKKK